MAADRLEAQERALKLAQTALEISDIHEWGDEEFVCPYNCELSWIGLTAIHSQNCPRQQALTAIKKATG